MLSKKVKDRRYKNRLARYHPAWRVKEIRRLNRSLRSHISQFLLSAKHMPEKEAATHVAEGNRINSEISQHNSAVWRLLNELLSTKRWTKSGWFAQDSAIAD